MRDRSFTPRDSARDLEFDEDCQVHEVDHRRSRVSSTLKNKTNAVLVRFLDKYRSRTVLEAVQKESCAADEFMEYVSRFKKFGLDKSDMKDAILMAIECSANAALSFIANAARFAGILGRDGMKQSLYKAILEYADCQAYFFRFYDEKFGSIEGADEVYFQLTHMDQYETGLIH